jgi:hypothetical protein
VLPLLVVLAFVGGHDRTPPVFGGLDRATTCIPGPIGGDRHSRYHLSWHAARDHRTPRARIVYDVYMAATPGGETFARATYTSAAGATSFATPPLSSVEQHYFVVRARDAAGNRDRNRREQLGSNLCA